LYYRIIFLESIPALFPLGILMKHNCLPSTCKTKMKSR
jgi:hypothetical protein